MRGTQRVKILEKGRTKSVKLMRNYIEILYAKPMECTYILVAFKELFPHWKIQEKWISITLRGRTCIVLLKADFNHKLDYKQEYI